MGINDRVQDRKDEKRGKQMEAKKRRVNGRGNGQVADWSSCNGELLAKAVASIAKHGGALRLGYTRDGGAYAVGFYGDGDPFTEYITPSDDIDEFLKGVIEDYGG